MKNLSQTQATDVNPDTYQPETHWMSAREVADAHANLIALRSTKNKTVDFGWKHFLHVLIEGDPTDTEYTISFTDRSPAYAQLDQLNSEHEERTTADPSDTVFPFRCRIKAVGKTFGLEDASADETPLGEAWMPPTKETSSPF